jgi:hypothetical protein
VGANYGDAARACVPVHICGSSPQKLLHLLEYSGYIHVLLCAQDVVFDLFIHADSVRALLDLCLTEDSTGLRAVWEIHHCLLAT